jgi:hypothetical protein
MRRLKVLAVVAAFSIAALVIAVGVVVLMRHFSSTSRYAGTFPTVAATCPPASNALDQVVPGGGGAAQTGESNAGTFGGLAGGLAGATPTPTPSNFLSCRALAPDIEAAFAAVDQDASALGNDEYDETARANELADANAVFAFVRDQIATEAYAGLMRGGLGALMSRGGSPDDKVLLLAQLLGQKGIAVRFVHANLADSEISAIITAILARSQSPSDPPATAVQMYQNALNSAKPFADQITHALAQSNIAMVTSDAALRAQWAMNLRDHWWLQALESGKWVDLDPTMPSAQPGTHLGATPSDPPITVLPDALYPTVTFRIIGDYVNGTSVLSQTLVSQNARTADAYAQPISIGISDPTAKLGNLTGSTSFVAVVSAGGPPASSAPFSPDPPSGARLLRLRLETEIDRPGYPALKQEQVILDRSNASGNAVDPSWTPQRTSVFLNGTRYYGLAIAGELAPQLMLAMEAQNAREMHSLLDYAINVGRFPFPSDAGQSYPIEVMRFFERDALLRALMNQQDGTEFFFDRPAIAFVHRVLDWNGTYVLARNDFDVVESARNVDGANMATAVADNIDRGVIEDADEADFALALQPAQVVTTRTVFASAGAGMQMVAVAPSASPPPLRALEAVAVSSSLARGAVVTISQPVSVGGVQHAAWWEVDPQTGSTVGRLESGGGQEETEYIRTTDVALEALDRANLVANTDLCLLDESVAGLSGGYSVEHKCLQEALCKFEVSQGSSRWFAWLYGEGWENVANSMDPLTGLEDDLCKNAG